MEALDAAGVADWAHGEIVAHLEHEHPETGSSWWRQSITVGYEQARGKRAVGETAAGFQVGVQRSVAASAAEVWDVIVSRPELWLGEGMSVGFEKGARYEVPARNGTPGASGEVRVVKPGDRLRMTWQPEGWAAPATLQLTLLQTGAGETAVHAQLEKLPDAEARETMRERWREALDRLTAAAGAAKRPDRAR